MFEASETLKPPDKFDFPFEPYKIQHDFMTSLYKIVQNKQIGIFESPTGTGKSLSLTCGVLKWLLDYDNLLKNSLNDKIIDVENKIKDLEEENSKMTDWIESQFVTIKMKEELVSLKSYLELIVKNEKRLADMKLKRMKEKKKVSYKKIEKTKTDFDLIEVNSNEVVVDDEFAIEDLDDQIDDDDDDNCQDGDEKDNDDQYKDVKIFFCSRTHSQLSQIVNEIKNTIYGKVIRVVSLASRQNYCINDNVRKLGSNALINERCLELQKNKTKTTAKDENGKTLKKSKGCCGCPYYNQANIENLKEAYLSEIIDIEELVEMGRREKACPYYAARAAAKDAQIVTLPYQMMFHKRTREQTGIDIKNSVIIVDEAHNLLDTIANIHNAEINLEQLQQASKQLNAYKNKYSSRFSAKNLLKFNQLIFVTNRLVKLLTLTPGDQPYRMIRTHELMSEGEFFTINLFHILQFCEQSRFAQKVHGFAQIIQRDTMNQINEKNKGNATNNLLKQLSGQKAMKGKKKANEMEIPVDKVANSIKEKIERISSPSVIRPLLAFLERLTEKSSDGRILLTSKSNNDLKLKPSMKYLLLNPASHFDDILSNCRSLIVAGGTMQPTVELTEQLFQTDSRRVEEHFYDHVVNEDAVLPMAVAKGPRGGNFLFNFATRNNKTILDELMMTLQNICNVVPAGIVIFFSSYDYLDVVYKYLEENDGLQKIQLKKKVFKEPRQSGQIEKILNDYSKCAKNYHGTTLTGAIMFSVVGGKLSEGLNFSDDLGRCVIVVGLPYPNKNSPEIIEKIKYLDKILKSGAGNEYYENLCMKAVNQCIGRAVRHINDYASVILLDERYTHDRIVKKLPLWIGRVLKKPIHFGAVQGSLAKFFKNKRQ